MLVVKVKDEGIGLPDSILQDIFKPFSARARQSSNQEVGTGFGLSICKQICNQLGGSIEAK